MNNLVATCSPTSPDGPRPLSLVFVLKSIRESHEYVQSGLESVTSTCASSALGLTEGTPEGTVPVDVSQAFELHRAAMQLLVPLRICLPGVVETITLAIQSAPHPGLAVHSGLCFRILPPCHLLWERSTPCLAGSVLTYLSVFLLI